MPRWITVTKAPFDHKFKGRQAYMHFTENGEFYVKDEVADDVVARKLATEGKASQATTAKKSAKKADDAADARSTDGMDRADLAQADRADSEPAVDDAG